LKKAAAISRNKLKLSAIEGVKRNARSAHRRREAARLLAAIIVGSYSLTAAVKAEAIGARRLRRGIRRLNAAARRLISESLKMAYCLCRKSMSYCEASAATMASAHQPRPRR